MTCGCFTYLYINRYVQTYKYMSASNLLDAFTVWGNSILLVIVCTFNFRLRIMRFDKCIMSFLIRTVVEVYLPF
jgi:hypothetical protein